MRAEIGWDEKLLIDLEWPNARYEHSKKQDFEFGWP